MLDKIIITQGDRTRLNDLIRSYKETNPLGAAHLDKLAKELKQAEIMESGSVPGDVITMRSKILLKNLKTGKEALYTLVYPEEANVAENKISVLAPVGTAMLGYKKGDTINWEIPSGMASLEVLDIVYQPEAAGDYNL